MRGFDDYVNMVLDDVTEYEIDADGTKRKVHLDQVGLIPRYLGVARYGRAYHLPGILLLYCRFGLIGSGSGSGLL